MNLMMSLLTSATCHCGLYYLRQHKTPTQRYGRNTGPSNDTFLTGPEHKVVSCNAFHPDLIPNNG